MAANFAFYIKSNFIFSIKSVYNIVIDLAKNGLGYKKRGKIKERKHQKKIR